MNITYLKIPILALIIFIFQPLDAQNNLSGLLVGVESIGLEIIDGPELFKGDELYYLVNGGADLYIEYGFEQVLAVEYSDSQRNSYQIEIFEMSDVSSAYGIFSFLKSKKAKPLEIGEEGVFLDYYLIFFRGNYYVSISADKSLGGSEENIFAIGKQIDDRINSISVLPDLVLKFISDTVLISDLKYIKGNIALNNIYLFDHKNIFGVGDGIVFNANANKVFIFEYPSNDACLSWFENSKYQISNNSKYTGFTDSGDNFNFIDPRNNSFHISYSKNFILINKGVELESGSLAKIKSLLICDE